MRWAAVVTVTLAAVGLCGAWARAEKKPPATPVPVVAMRIPVAPLGYLPPGAFYTTNRFSSAALGFFDNDHLLFVFPVNTLLERMPGDPDDDANQEVRAVVLDLKSGKAVRQTQWRLRDHERYLWPFADGKFLLRIANSLYLVGPALTPEPWLRTPTALRAVEVSPQRKWMAVEYDDLSRRHTGPSLRDAGTDVTPVKIVFLPVGSRQAAAKGELDTPGLVSLMSDGLLQVKEGKQIGSWLLNQMPFSGDPRFVGSVKSFCHPKVEPLSESVALVSWCTQNGDGQPVFAVNLEGKQLWQDLWQSKYVWPYFESAENGSRFVYESVAINVPMSVVGDTLDQDEITGQMAGVYDTETGKLVLAEDASPVITAGQNVALSPDGRRFAILRKGAIEIYDLPPVAAAAPHKGH